MNNEISNIGKVPEWFERAMAVPRQDLELSVQGSTVRCFHWGDDTKPPLILFHGFLSHRRCWAFIAPLLAEKYSVFAVDFLGMGDSGTAPIYTLDSRMDEIGEVIEALQLKEKPLLAGHSFGGGLLMHFAHRKGDSIKAILACDTFMLRPQDIDGWMNSPQHNRRAPSPKRKLYPDWETIYGRFVLSPPQSVACPFLFEYMAKHSVKQLEEGWTWKFDPAIMQRTEAERLWWADNLDIFSEISVPKAIIYGGESSLVMRNAVEYLQEKCAEKKQPPFPAILIPDAHHHVMLDKPQELVKAMDEVLAAWL